MKLESPVGSHLAFDKDDQKAHGVKEKISSKRYCKKWKSTFRRTKINPYSLSCKKKNGLQMNQGPQHKPETLKHREDKVKSTL